MATGTTRSATCIRPTISRNSPAASARRPARKPARSTSRTFRSPSRRSSRRSPTRPTRPGISGPIRPRRRPASGSPSSAPGPAGMAAAQQLGRAGHDVHVYERESQARRADALRHPRLQDGEALHRPPRRADAGRGRDLPLRRQCRRRQAGRRAAGRVRRGALLRRLGDAARRPAFPAPISTACTTPCPISCSRTSASAARTSSRSAWPSEPIIAGGKHVVVVGGGDTASDCVGTAFRQGAVRVTQLDIRPQPPEKEDKLDGLALLGDQDAHLVLAGRRRRARVPGGDARIHRRGRRSLTGVQVLRGRREAQADRRHRIRHPRRSRLHRHRLCRARSPDGVVRSSTAR